ncbi:putative minus-end-directed kinesin ATPase [Helianthus annuus]|nr:putative minus-end-directed kinesin ATPase [Helianthus annuus]
MDRETKEHGRLNFSYSSASSDVFEPTSVNDAKTRTSVIEWLNSTLPNLNLPVNASDEELRTLLADGIILCRLMNRLRPVSDIEYGNPRQSSEAHSENVSKFLAAMDEMGLPHFNKSELEKGSMKIVWESLLTLKAHFMPKIATYSPNASSPKSFASDSLRWKHTDEHGGTSDSFQEDTSPRKVQRALRNSEATGALMHHAGHKFHEVFQMKHGGYSDLPAAKISELMKSNSLDIAPTQSLLSMVNGILDESMGRKNGEIPHRVACLMRKVVQEIERRISTQAEHLRTQNNLFKTREEKYQSRIRVLEALANGTSGETKAVISHFDHMKMMMSPFDQIKVDVTRTGSSKKDPVLQADKTILSQEKKNEDEGAKMKEKDSKSSEIAALKKEKDSKSSEIAALKQELENARKTHEDQKEAARKSQLDLEKQLKDVENRLIESQMNLEDVEAKSRSKSQWWTNKEHIYKTFTEFQLGALKELRFASQSVRQELLKTQKTYAQDFDNLGTKFKVLKDAVESYDEAVSENQKLHNEIQELKGNIRVYCRIRPFLPGQKDNQSTVDYIGDNGELIVFNPSKPGKESRRSFKYNKVYGPHATQAEVYGDIQQLVRSVLDGYNVCIFAYGQTGSGKTYTMSGPDKGTEEEWGVNYRALNDLFRISQSRSTYKYEVGVQLVEIYNEQVRDLLANDAAPKKFGILATASLAVPDANMREVSEPADVLRLMEIGFKNRARSSTSMNERSSRSHSVVTIHVHGTDLKNGGSVNAGLHLVDLAGSERIDRAEVVGDRLKEAQHINKSLAALGDVIFALAQKSPHVPFRNSKLTQVLQSSLGGQAKTLMLVQLNPEASSYAESLSTLKFAERVSGVELGPARSNQEASNVKDLMEQVASLKSTIAKKDEEIEKLQAIKDKKSSHPPSVGQRSLRYGSSSPVSKVGSSNKRTDSIRGRMSLDGYGYKPVRKGQSPVSSHGEDTDSSLEGSPSRDGSKSLHSTSKPKTGSRISRPLTKISKDLPKAAKGMFKSTSGSSLTAKSPSKRW